MSGDPDRNHGMHYTMARDSLRTYSCLDIASENLSKTISVVYDKNLVLPMECIHVTWVKTDVLHVGECVVEICSPSVDWWNGLHYLAISITVEMLREEDVVGWTIVVSCDVDAWHFVQSDIVVANCQNHWHQMANCGRQGAIESQVVVPGVHAGWHIVIISNVTTHKIQVWLECRDDLGELDGCLSVTWVTSIDHSDWDWWVVTQCLVYGIGPELVVVKYSDQILGWWFQAHNQCSVDCPLVHPIQTMVFVCFCLYLILLWTVESIDFLIVDCHIIDTNMRV